MGKNGGGVSRFSVECFLSHSAEKNSWGNPTMFQKISSLEKN